MNHKTQEKGCVCYMVDIVGSIYEFANIKNKKFPLFLSNGYITDDSCMTIAMACAIRDWKQHGGDFQSLATKHIRSIDAKFPDMGYGAQFWQSNGPLGQPPIRFDDK